MREPGDAAPAAGTATVLGREAGITADALTRIRTVALAAPMPRASRVRGVEVISVQVAPPLRLYSILVVTPVIVSVVPLYTALGVPAGALAVTLRVAEANCELVAATRT